MRRLQTYMICLLLAATSGCQEEARSRAASSQPTETNPITRESKKGPVTARVTVDRDAMEVPQTAKLTLEIEAEAGIDVKLPKVGESLGSFLVKDSSEPPPRETDATKTIRREWTLEAVLPGEAEVPAFEIGFTDAREKADGSSEPFNDVVKTEPLRVTVTQRLADLKPPVSLPWPRSYVILAWTLAIIAALAIIAFAARKWWKRRQAMGTIRREPVVLPHDWALAELDKLAAEGLIERGRIQEFYYRLNWILRHYIELRYGLRAGEQTSEEFVRELGRCDVLNDQDKMVLRRFVDACDPVKYARQSPQRDDIDWVQTTAREFVVRTIPSPADGNGHAGAKARQEVHT